MNYTKREDILSSYYALRIEASERLMQSRTPRGANAAALIRVAESLRNASSAYNGGVAGRTLESFAELLQIVSMLVEWRSATIEAKMDADRFLRAAKERFRLWCDTYAKDESMEGLERAARPISQISSVVGVSEICAAVASTPLPLGIFREPDHRGIRMPSAEFTNVQEAVSESTVAFLQFSVDGIPAKEIHYLSPGETHDLSIEVRVSRWPEQAHDLELQVVTIEPPGSYEMPIFRFSRPKGDPPFSLQQRGRAVIKNPQHLQARPFEFKYKAEFLPVDSEQPVETAGQRVLQLEGVDWRNNSLSGYANIDPKILEIREKLRQMSGLLHTDIESVLDVTIALTNLAGRALQDSLFKGKWSEADFQKYVRAALRQHPRIGSHLEEHAHVSGGETDLSFRGIRIELKSVSQRTIDLEGCTRFVDQTVSYVVGTGKRVGVLCVLDCSEKQRPAFPAEDCIGILRSEGEWIVCTYYHDSHSGWPCAAEPVIAVAAFAFILSSRIAVYIVDSPAPEIDPTPPPAARRRAG